MRCTISFNIDGMPIMSLVSNFMLVVDGVPYIQFEGGGVDSSIDPALTTEESMRHIDVPIETVTNESTEETYTIYGDGNLLPGDYVVKRDWSTNVCTISVDENRNYSLTFDYNDSSVTMPLLTHRIPVTGIVEGSAGKNIIGSFYGSSEVEGDSGGDEPIEEPQDEHIFVLKIDDGEIEINTETIDETLTHTANWIFDSQEHYVSLWCDDSKITTEIQWEVNGNTVNSSEVGIYDSGVYEVICTYTGFPPNIEFLPVTVTVNKKQLYIINKQITYNDKTFKGTEL